MMIKIILPFAIIGWMTVVAPSSFAQSTPPSEESVRELIRLNDVAKSVDIVRQDIESSIQKSVRQAFTGETLTERQERILSEMSTDAAAMFRKEFNAETLEPLYIDIYRKSLTQEEVDGLIAFYKTEPGKALLVKMPAISKQAITITLERMKAVMPKLNAIQNDIIRRMREEK